MPPIVVALIIGVLTNFLFLKVIIFFCLTFLMPYIFNSFILPFINTSQLSAVFNALPPEVWYVLEIFHLDFGVPLLISAVIASFLVRRMPLVG